MTATRRFDFCFIVFVLLVAPALLHAADGAFDRKIAPIFATHCLECHHGADAEGGFVLSRRDDAFRGGESGDAAIVAGDLAKSNLWQRIESDEMPPEHPLPAKEKAIIRAWIEAGAKWGAESIDPFQFSNAKRAGYDWWSLQPLRDVKPPQLEDSWIRNDIDRFVLMRLREAGLQPSETASPRTLLRRIAFDLAGLPIDAKAVERFAADPSDERYAQAVQELLASPAYGERWGRHWLDVVRYGESDGFERNKPRRTAWPYRDWVIKSLNDDLSYDQFVRMQLIGDILEPNLEGASATGFWVAGVHNTVVGGSERMKKLARQDEIEDVLAAVGQTFLGLTINCGRCHDHKFDPVTQAEYYQLASAISGLGFGERKAPDARFAPKLDETEGRIRQLTKVRNDLRYKAREAVLAARDKGQLPVPKEPMPIARWEFDGDMRDSIGKLHARPIGESRVKDGALTVSRSSHAVTARLDRDLGAKTLSAWVQLDNLGQRGGAAISIQTPGGAIFDAIVFGEQEPTRWMAGSDFFRRTESFQGTAEEEASGGPVHIAIVYQEDGTIAAYREGFAYGRPYRKAQLQRFKAGEAEVLFGLRHDGASPGKQLAGKIFRASLYDRALKPEEVAAVAGNFSEYITDDEIAGQLGEEAYARLTAAERELSELEKQRVELAKRAEVTLYTLKPGRGAVVNRLLRGDPDKVAEVVSPKGVAAVKGVSPDFELKPDSPEKDRRKKLADWITDQNNPLLDRVIVNRVWHYHFGQGIVSTPNDLGFNGGRPSHPDLLDWLAAWFRGEGRSLKRLHQLIVTSATYRQASRPRPEGLNKDAGNRLLWRMSPRRLEAEVIRDAMLVAAGKLNRELGGPSFEDVTVTPNNGTTYYEPKTKIEPAFFRRTVYRFNPRGGRSALLDTFDCPDTAATTPRRAITTTPLQALSLLNNNFVIAMADHFAERVQTEAKRTGQSEVDTAWRIAIARRPNAHERQLSENLVKKHGLPALCRGLFNVSEFVIAD